MIMYYDDNVQFAFMFYVFTSANRSLDRFQQAFSPNSHIYTNMPWAALNMQVILKQALLAL